MITWFNRMVLSPITRRLERSYFPYLLLVVSLFITVALTYYIAQQISEIDQLRFDAQSDHTINTVENAFETSITILRAGSGLISASEIVTEREFRAFAEKLQLRENYPGIQGIVYAIWVTDESQREDLYPTGDRSDYTKVIHLQPLDLRNQEAIGFDMYAEPVRHEAMERALETGQTAMSGKVKLVQEIDQDVQAGFLMYVPVYEGGVVPESPEERRASIQGFVYSPFRADDFFNTLRSRVGTGLVDFAIYDRSISEENLLYTSAERNVPDDLLTLYTKQTPLVIGGHDLIIVTFSTPFFNRTSEQFVVPIVFFGGLVLSFILFLLNYMQLRSQESKIEILEGITDGFISVNRKWKVKYVNQRGAAIFSTSPEELLNKPFWEKAPADIRSECAKECVKTMSDRKSRRIEMFFPSRNEWYLIRIYPSHHGLSLFFQDITDRKRMEDRKDEFISIASHELKTPITSIRGFVQLASQKLEKNELEPIPGYIDRILVYIDRLNSLISDLLDVSKIKARKLELHLEKFKLNDLVYDGTESIQHLMKKHRLVIRGALHEEVVGDRQRLGQVLTNLLSNAIKYSPLGEKIEIDVKKQSRNFLISVRDYGIGIEKYDQAKIFNRFFRSNRTPEEVTGLGIGLYVASEIVKYHGGKLTVKSTPGKGSIFQFTIPRRAKRKRRRNTRI